MGTCIEECPFGQCSSLFNLYGNPPSEYFAQDKDKHYRGKFYVKTG